MCLYTCIILLFPTFKNFLFEIILDYRKVAKIVLSTLHSASHNVNILHNYNIIIKTKKLTSVLCHYLNYRFFQISPIFLLMFFFAVVGANPWFHLSFNCDVSLASSNLLTVPPSFLAFHDCHFWRVLIS